MTICPKLELLFKVLSDDSSESDERKLCQKLFESYWDLPPIKVPKFVNYTYRKTFYTKILKSLHRHLEKHRGDNNIISERCALPLREENSSKS
jgi:hypothetical protein